MRVESLTDDELNQFINRQLVSTNQSIKAVTTLLRQLYPDTDVVFSKAENVSDFRRDFGFIKVRSINHHHHAKDAYLNIVVGNIYHEKFTKNFFAFAKQNGTHRTYNLTKMFEKEIRSTENKDSIIWDPQVSMDTVKTMMRSNDVRVTQRAVPQKGGLSDETVYKKGVAKRGVYLPLKSSDIHLSDVEKYGGRTKMTIAEYVILKIVDIRDKEKIEIFPLPLYVSNQGCLRENIIALHIKGAKDAKKIKFVEVMYRGLYIGSLVNINGFKYYLGGRTGDKVCVDCAIDLVLDNDISVYIKLLEKVEYQKIENPKTFDIHNITTTYLGNEIYVTAEDNKKLYQAFMDKLSTPLFIKLKGNKIEEFKTIGFDKFCELSLENQVTILMEMLNIITNFKTTRNLELINIKSSRSTVGINVSNTESFSVITTSITGLYENEIKIK